MAIESDAARASTQLELAGFTLGSYEIEPCAEGAAIVLACTTSVYAICALCTDDGTAHSVEWDWAEPFEGVSIPIVVEELSEALKQLLDFWAASEAELAYCDNDGTVTVLDRSGHEIIGVAGRWHPSFAEQTRGRRR